MPDIFKALATILAWVLWISGMVIAISTLVLGIMRGHLFAISPPPTGLDYDPYIAWFALALAYGIGAVVVMILRKKME